MNERSELWKDGKLHTVYRDDKGIFRKAEKKRVEIVDWITKDWVNRRAKPFNPKIQKIYI